MVPFNARDIRQFAEYLSFKQILNQKILIFV